ncbi:MULTISPECIES: hypothetical protein [unclassified Pseudofrankia]|uniref:hypothetical protein n=1 Tax=unclassified Pseudofrankia TaxID=2994372 RepID=UPI001041E8A8|nr:MULTISPECIES: hypothetical protein [unclassified Pseudofrankia]MDT3442044.1 hypothetical protein [Pseudofrankia sp. BMG5.37]
MLSPSAQTPLSAMLDEVLERDGVAAWPRSCPRSGDGLVVRPLVDPSPVYPWSLVWRRRGVTERLRLFLAAAAATAAERRWLPVVGAPPALAGTVASAEPAERYAG